jgi:hypothetical protein
MPVLALSTAMSAAMVVVDVREEERCRAVGGRGAGDIDAPGPEEVGAQVRERPASGGVRGRCESRGQGDGRGGRQAVQTSSHAARG